MANSKKNKNIKSKKSKKDDLANPMWGGQFELSADDLLREINSSIEFDKELYRQDIEGSIAHARMLTKQKIISSAESAQIISGLKEIFVEIEEGKFTFKEELEDIHMNIEAALAEKIGKMAGKLHTARSRNDQVATDFRLYVRSAFDAMIAALKELQSALLARAAEHSASAMPGFTHLQTAQPVTLGHHLLAYVEMFGRDASRAQDARSRLNESPLGAAALAGTSFPIDRDFTAKELGFSAPMSNSIDAVSDRDFALEYLSSASICAMHLSRLAEELIIWSSAQFGFMKFSDRFSTGSSIMPQKRNPDAAELVRGKSGRVFGHFISLITTMKALPLAYNKDMQEDKEALFDAARTITISINVMRAMILDASFNVEKMREAANSGYSTATDLADFIVQNLDMPFRQAHHTVARIVKLAVDKRKNLDQLSLAEIQSVEPRITKAALAVLAVDSSLASRKSYGGTAPANVKQAIVAARKRWKL